MEGVVPMLRHVIATLVLAACLASPGPALATQQAPAPGTRAHEAAEKPAAGVERSARRIPHNKKVTYNAVTKVFHDPGCRHVTPKMAALSAKEAKLKGGKPCQACLK
jgi:hypothetical protein